MKNNSQTPAFPCSDTMVEKQEGTPFETLKRLNYTGITKREYMAAKIACSLIKPIRTPKTFVDFLKIKLNNIGFNFGGIKYKYTTTPRTDAQLVAIYTDAILNQLEGRHVS